MAYAGIESFGDARADFRAARIWSLTANINRSADSDPVDIRDFAPWMNQDKGEQDTIDHELTDEELATWADAAIFGIAPDGL